MPIRVGETLPSAELLALGPDGPEPVDLVSRLSGRRVVIFGLPGAFTPTCHSAHLPSFIRAMGALGRSGVDEVICVSVNDPYVMQAWGAATGATDAGITMLSDAGGAFTRALGMAFDYPPAGYHGRSKRYALAADDGVVTVWHPEPGHGCDISGGGAMVLALGSGKEMAPPA